MKTALKIIGGIVGILVLAAGIFYFGWLSPPDAEAVCANVERIAQDEVSKKTEVKSTVSAKAVVALKDDCMRRATKAPEFGKAVWVKRLKCMRDAADMTGLRACDEIKSM